MSYFLSDSRRADLQTKLQTFGMPAHIASHFTTVPDDVHEVDVRMAAQTNQAAHYAKKLADCDDTKETAVLAVFILACVMIMDAFKAEIKERDIGHEFSIWAEAAKECEIKVSAIRVEMEQKQNNTTVH